MINVIGLGYIGLPTSLMMAAHGVEVKGTDYNEQRVADLNNGEGIFEEDGLKELYDCARKNGITFSTQYQSAEVYIIAVPTPYMKESKKIDPSFVVAAVKSVLDECPTNATIVVESTIAPGIIDDFVRPLIGNKSVHLAHAPERIIPGNMLYELEHNSRTIGVDDEETGLLLKNLYSSFCKGDIVITDIRTAEMTKVVENAYRDVNIAFANELLKICRRSEMDVYEVIRIANMHPRVNILSPGPGVGGHCISVDPWFLVGDYPDLTNVILAARETNDRMPQYVINRIRDIRQNHGIEDVSRIGLYGLTYKENVDDTRESPTLQLLDLVNNPLSQSGARVYDPYITEDIVANQYHSLEEFLDGLRLIVIMIAHDEIRENMIKLSELLVLDTRNMFNTREGVYKL